MVVRFFPYAKFHGKPEMVGSDYIRAAQLIKHWPEADVYKYGEFPDVLIFNKVFMSQDYQFHKHFENITILDICDPLWLEGQSVVETCQAVDAVTCPTEELAKFIRQFKKEVVVIPDRFDMDIAPGDYVVPEDRADTVVWFGYSHNIAALKPAIPYIIEKNLKLLIISNDNPEIQRWGAGYEFIKYNEETIYHDLQRADFAILPDGTRPQDKYKSNNREIKSNLAGLPVAKTPEDVDLYMSAEARQEWFNTKYEIIKAEYDVRKSVQQYKDLINEIKS